MSDWTAGYVADIDYTYGYYAELNPLRARLAFINAGLVPPELGYHCELGFGQGLSVNIHAAGAASNWHGNDFNPAQAGFAQDLAEAAGAGANLSDASFADFCTRADLPEFDSIGLHGIWSWISDANRAIIVDFIARKLKVGGALYVSYNTQPGWAAFAPLRHLMAQHADVMGAPGAGTVKRVDAAMQFVSGLMATSPSYAQANPQMAERLAKLMDKDRHYLAHEYFNRDWHPVHFSTMVEALAPAKLQFACSAHFLDHVDALNLLAPQQAFLKEIADPVLRESVRDFMVNQQFRRDYWVKGARKLSVLERVDALQAQQLILVRPMADITLKVKGAIGEGTLQEAVYRPILDAVAGHQPVTIGQILAAVKPHGLTLPQLTTALMVLVGAGHLAPVQGAAQIGKARKYCQQLNARLIERARGSLECSYLASPVTGGGVNLSRFQQLFLLSLSQGKKLPEQWAQQTWQILAALDQQIVKEGRTLVGADANLAELRAQANTFASNMLPVLKALQIA